MNCKGSKAGNTKLVVLLIVCMAGVGVYYGLKMFKGTKPDRNVVDVDAPSPPAVEALVEEDENSAEETAPAVVDAGHKRLVKWDDGSSYDGQLAEGLRNGDGVYTWKSGSKYDGGWKNGKRHGKGVYTWSDGTVYDGDWLHDAQSGTGKCTWVSGSVYEGEWSEGEREGRGIYRWSDGETYDGLWQDDKQVEEIDDTTIKGDDSEVVSTSSRNMLWKIKGDKNVVYLFGSIHMLKESHYPLVKVIQKAFDDSQVIVFEVDPKELTSPETQKTILSLATLPEGETLKGSVSEETFTNLTEECGKLGIHVGGLNLFKPWFAAVTLVAVKAQAMGFKPEHGIEMRFYEKAKTSSKEVEALETAEFQLKLFNELDEKNRNSFLQHTLDDIGLMEQNLKDIVKHWKEGNLEALSELLLESFDEHPDIQEKLINKRNADWAIKIQQYLKSDKNYMVIGGALHFPGEKGVLSLLKASSHYPEQL